jgi:hypothetical protein
LKDARSQALAGNTVMNEGVFALFGNSAGLAKAKSIQAIATVESPFLLEELQRGGFGFLLPLENSAFSLKASTFGLEDYRETQLSLGYSRLLSSNLSIGAELIYWNNRIPEYGNRDLLTFAIGMQANLSPTVQVGAHLYNPIRADISDNETTYSTLQVGGSYRPSDRLSIMAEVYKDVDFPAQVRAGIDYEIDPRFAIRLGVGTLSTLYSFGVGVQLFPGWFVDIAASRHEFLGFSPGFSLRYMKE